MAKKKNTPETTTPANGINSVVGQLKAQGLEPQVHTYSHGYIDVVWKDAQGERQLLEYRPDGSELQRDAFGREVK